MRGMDSGSHYTGIIFLKKQVEYDGKIVPWNMRHILQKCFIGSRVYKAAGGPGFHGAVIGKPGRMNGGQSLIGAVQFQKLLSDFLQRAAFQILMVAVIEINSRSYRIFVFGNAQTIQNQAVVFGDPVQAQFILLSQGLFHARFDFVEKYVVYQMYTPLVHYIYVNCKRQLHSR